MLKKTLFIGLALMGALMINSANAQCGKGHMQQDQHKCNAIPDLTEDQAGKIDALRLPHQKAMMDLKNQVSEKEAKLITLTTGDNIDVNAAKIVMKEIADLKLKMAEARLDHKMAVRKILNEEQQFWFDQHHAMSKCHMGQGQHGPGMGKGMHSCSGNGQGIHKGNGQGMHDGTGPHGSGNRNHNSECPNKTE